MRTITCGTSALSVILGSKRATSHDSSVTRRLSKEISWSTSSAVWRPGMESTRPSTFRSAPKTESRKRVGWTRSRPPTRGWPAVQVAFADLTDDAIDARLASLGALPTVRGVRQIVGRAPAEDRMSGTDKLSIVQVLRPVCGRLRERVSRSNCSCILNSWTGRPVCLARFPNSTLYCATPGPDRPYAKRAAHVDARTAKLSELPNMRCKLSGLGMFDHDWTAESISPFVETCLEQFGPERCMFGSNFPVDSLTSDYSTLVDAYSALIPLQHHEPVFGGTARNFYRIT